MHAMPCSVVQTGSFEKLVDIYRNKWCHIPEGCILNTDHGRDIGHAVIRRLPTAAVRVRAQVKSCGIFSVQNGTGACFLRVLLLPLLILIPPAAPHSSSSIIRGWYNRSISDRRTKLTQSHPTPRTPTSKY
jgi:hypothetical protein